MSREIKKQMSRIRARLILLELLGTLGGALVGLGLYDQFSEQGLSSFPLFDQGMTTWLLTGIGAILVIWELLVLLPSAQRYRKLRTEHQEHSQKGQVPKD